MPRKSDTFGIGKVMDSIKKNTTDAILEIKPEEMTENAEKKLENIKAFRQEIHESLQPILDQLETVKAKFTGKMYSEEEAEHTPEEQQEGV